MGRGGTGSAGAAGEEELADFETDVLAGFVLVRVSVGLVDGHGLRGHQPFAADPGLVRASALGDPGDADSYVSTVLRESSPLTWAGRRRRLTVYSEYLVLCEQVELHNLTGRPWGALGYRWGIRIRSTPSR